MSRKPPTGLVPIIIGLSLLMIAIGMLFASVVEHPQPIKPLEISNMH